MSDNHTNGNSGSQQQPILNTQPSEPTYITETFNEKGFPNSNNDQ